MLFPFIQRFFCQDTSTSRCGGGMASLPGHPPFQEQCACWFYKP